MMEQSELVILEAEAGGEGLGAAETLKDLNARSLALLPPAD